ncbi:MAG: hypothetical protein ACPGVE_07570, partial [Flavobacteriales bacterium]
HLNSRIPSYNLVKCYDENPLLNKYINTLNFTQSLSCLTSHLWDEENEKMISFRQFFRNKRAMAQHF